MRVAIGSDHRGVECRAKVAAILEKLNHEVVDCGTFSADSVDYPDIAVELARVVVAGDAHCGILLCGTGIGVSIAANKVNGIRAAVVHDLNTAEMSRRHNDANVLCCSASLRTTRLPQRSRN